MQRQHTSAAGFTLIEITVVVIIISLVMSMAIVRLDSVLPSTRNESVARELIATLDFARLQAIGRGHEYEVVLDFDKQQYGIRMPFDDEGRLVTDDDEKTILRWREISDGVEMRSVLDPRGVRIREGQYPIPFDSQGAARDVYIYIGAQENTDYEVTVRILGLTGIPSVAQGTLEPSIHTESDF